MRVEQSKDSPDALRRACARPALALIDVVTDKPEIALPSKIQWTRAKGFGRYMPHAVSNSCADEALELANTRVR